MQKNNFILFFFSIMGIYILRFIWMQLMFILLDKEFISNFFILLFFIGMLFLYISIRNKTIPKCLEINFEDLAYNKMEGFILLFFTVLYSICPTTIEFTSPFISYWIIKKYLSGNTKIQNLFLNYACVKRYALGLFMIESMILVFLLLSGIQFKAVVYMYLIFFSKIFCFIWYLPFLIMAFININKNKQKTMVDPL